MHYTFNTKVKVSKYVDIGWRENINYIIDNVHTCMKHFIHLVYYSVYPNYLQI